jgi:hypothetical protein
MMVVMFLSIPEGVSVMTVISDGVEPEGRPLGITTQCALNG